MTKPRLKTFAHWLAVLALCIQAAVPLGQAVSLPGSAQPIVICSAFGLKTIYVYADGEDESGAPATGRPGQGEPGSFGTNGPCIVCLSLAASALEPPDDTVPTFGALRTDESAPGRRAFCPQAMPTLLGIFARPPPAPLSAV